MLNELRNIAQNNLVIYATHSNHMIIKDNYDQHFIVEKKKDTTKVEVSQKKRIGYFMQEEVLYEAMGVNLASDMSSIEDYNFVFEGIGDVVLFHYFYNSVLKPEERPFDIKKVMFFQGGKCSSIKNTFVKRPIQLGSKWIFILDRDDPAKQLGKFINGKYKDYVSKDIFVFHYASPENAIELEDLLPKDIIKSVYIKTFTDLKIDFDINKLDKILSKQKTCYAQFNEAIKIKFHAKENSLFTQYFKEFLNDEIEKGLDELNSGKDFNSRFKKYFDFATFVINNLSPKDKT